MQWSDGGVERVGWTRSWSFCMTLAAVAAVVGCGCVVRGCVACCCGVLVVLREVLSSLSRIVCVDSRAVSVLI